jgi:hypothetical protein
VISSKFATGIVAVTSVVALSGGVASANAAPEGAAETAKVRASCNSWHNAVGIPGRWTTSKYHCSLLGSGGLRVRYSWTADRGTPCIQVKYFVNGSKKWTESACRKSGTLEVPWGNVAAHKEIKIKGASTLKWR